MIIDFPDYTHANPWQLKTIETSAFMEVVRTNNLRLQKCFAMHISWEDCLLRKCTTEEQAINIVEQFEQFILKQSKLSKIIWTVHNLKSHSNLFPAAENKLRGVIMERCHQINIMSEKHLFMIPQVFREKVCVIHHYIDRNPYFVLPREKKPKFFRYGAPRDETNLEYYKSILNCEEISKFVSDDRINKEIVDGSNVITKRRFTFHEADLYSRISNFAIFFRNPNLNSGVFNFYLGSGLIIYHNSSSVMYLDLPQCYDKFQVEEEYFCLERLKDDIASDHLDLQEMEQFFSIRTPDAVSSKFWANVVT